MSPTKTKNIQTKVSSLPHQTKVLETVKQAQDKRDEANRKFIENRARWANEEREKGSNNPEREVVLRHRQGIVGINDEEHRLIRQAFKDHGHVLPKQKEKTLVHDFNQAMG